MLRRILAWFHRVGEEPTVPAAEVVRRALEAWAVDADSESGQWSDIAPIVPPFTARVVLEWTDRTGRKTTIDGEVQVSV